MKKLLIVLMALMMMGCVSISKYQHLQKESNVHVNLRNQVIAELVNAKNEEEKQSVVEKYGIRTQEIERGAK